MEPGLPEGPRRRAPMVPACRKTPGTGDVRGGGPEDPRDVLCGGPEDPWDVLGAGPEG